MKYYTLIYSISCCYGLSFIMYKTFLITAMLVYGNGNDYTTQFITEENFAVFLTGIVLRRQNHTLVVAFSESGDLNNIFNLNNIYILC